MLYLRAILVILLWVPASTSWSDNASDRQIDDLISKLGPIVGWGGQCANGYDCPSWHSFVKLVDLGPPAVDKLIDATKDSDSWRRMLSAYALGLIGDRRAVPVLIALLRGDEVAGVRCGAACALGNVGDLRATGPLLEAVRLPKSKRPAGAIEALGSMKNQAAIDALEPLLGDDSPESREKSAGLAAAGALARIGKASVPVLLKTLRNGTPYARMAAAEGLGLLKERRALPGILALLGDGSGADFPYLAQALGMIGDDRRAVPAVLTIMQRTGDNYVRMICADTLGKLGDRRAVEPLLGRHWEVIERDVVDQALGNMRDRRALDAVKTDVSSTDHMVADAATIAVGKIGGPGALSLLLARLGSADDSTKSAAAKALGFLKDRRAVAPLIALLASESELGMDAVWALGQIGDPRAHKSILLALGSESPSTRAAAAEALGAFRRDGSIDALIHALKDEFWDVRRNAARSLGQLGAVEAIEPLKALAIEYEPRNLFSPDDEGSTRKVVQAAMRQIESSAWTNDL